MSIRSGKRYSVKRLNPGHVHWRGVQKAVERRTRQATGQLNVAELYDVKWRSKPFPWSWTREFKPQRRFFFHGTSAKRIAAILDQGFKLCAPKHGRMLGAGTYLTYHTHKGKMYGVDGYVISAMIYAPKTLIIQPGQSLSTAQIQQAASNYHAIEVRTRAQVIGYPMKNHEICVFDTRRVVPRFIIKFK